MAQLKKILPFEVKRIWGGESWVLSTHKLGASLLGGVELSHLCDLSYLVKFIYAHDFLSIQVHPGDEYARVHENELGKTECWLITATTTQDAGIYLGFKEGVTKKEFKTALQNALDVRQFLKFRKVSPGDFFLVPAGTVHSIGAGVSLLEVQQSSGVTYRVWDFNRVDSSGKGRELHIEKALDVLDFSEKLKEKVEENMKKNLFNSEHSLDLATHSHFKVKLHCVKENEPYLLKLAPKGGVVVVSDGLVYQNEILKKEESFISLDGGDFYFNSNKPSYFVSIE